jgi:hypothetical protein
MSLKNGIEKLRAIKFPWDGSFQSQKFLLLSENPLEEVWTRVGQLGNESFLDKRLEPFTKDDLRKKHINYAAVRIRQSLEFRQAFTQSTLLTSPLPLYYSFLNLTRALLRLGSDKTPEPTHGLKFCNHNTLLDTKAKIVKGTFSNYLDSQSIRWENGDEVSLGEALGFIIELRGDYEMFDPNFSCSQSIRVDAIRDGDIHLKFLNFKGDFSADWQKAFPDLVDVCDYSSDNTLLVRDGTLSQGYNKIADFLRKHFEPSLTFTNRATWHKFRKDNSAVKLNRVAYYFVAVFILGSIARYEPELLLEVSIPGSEIGWLLQRFLKLAERYFPQLKLMEIYNSEVYFSSI